MTRAIIQTLMILFISSESRINIHVLDAEAQPLAGVRIFLDLHFMEGSEIRGAYSDECTTDQNGECTLHIGETHGQRLRGTLDLGSYGSRIVEWNGGVLDVPIQIHDRETARPLDPAAIYSAILFPSLFLAALFIQRKGSQVHAAESNVHA